MAWRQGFRRPCIVIPCGGGKSIITADMAKRTTQNGGRVLFIVHRRELCEQIENTFRDYGVDMDLCTVGMVQTVSRRIDKLDAPKLIITDENHHCLATSYKKIYAAFPDAYCVGVTATPVRLNGGGLGEINDKLIIGPSVKELINRHCLADFDYYAPAVIDTSTLKKRSGDFVQEEAAMMLDKPKIYGDVINYYRRLSDGKQAVCYCPTVDYSKRMAQQFCAENIPAAHIDGTTPPDERAEIIDSFRNGKIKILCNVDLISEGFDVPDCSTAILLRPTKSLTLFIQQSMRCMRYKEGKRAVIIDHVGNVHRFGLPDKDRTWSLDPKPPAKKSAVPVKQCTRCFYTHAPSPVCPKCGYVYPKSEREAIEEEKEVQLMKITERVAEFDTPDKCRTMKELLAYAKKKNYKPGWAYHQAKLRRIL
jgi:superfamily II DNA or RNA helicase